MYDAAQIKAGFLDFIGWRTELGSAPAQPVGLLTTRSGLYYNDAHPLLTYANLRSIAPDFSVLTFTAWSGATTYVTGNMVSIGGKVYRAIAGSLNQTPPNATYWEEVHFFAEWLQEKTEAGILRAVEDWIASKFDQRTARTLLANSRLFPHTRPDRQPDVNESRLAGVEIVPSASDNMLLRVDEIGLCFTDSQTVTVRLYSSNSAVPIQEEELVYTEEGSEQWFSLGWNMPAGPVYYIAYSQAEIIGNSLNGVDTFDFMRHECSRVLYPSAFTAPGDGTELWNARQNRYSASTNYGLNLRITVRCDYTRFLLSQGDILKGLIQKSVAMSLLREMAYNPSSRVNRNESNVSQTQILYEIDGDSQGRPGGLKMAYDAEMKAARFDRENIDAACIPCRTSGVKYRTI